MHWGETRRVIILLFGLGLLWLGLAGQPAANTGSQTGPSRPHPLVGRLWGVEAERFVSPGRLYAQLQDADFILLGEVHSNPEHHRLQQLAIERLVAHGRRPAVVFEMFERADQPLIERSRRLHPEDAAAIAHITRMDARGWPPKLYRSLIEAVLMLNLPLVGADLSEADTRAIVEDGLDSLGAERLEELGLDGSLAQGAMEVLRADIIKAHCGHVPSSLVDGMVAAQRARDAMLADGLISHANEDGAVLIAGSGHVRADLAVPVYLRRRAPDQQSVSIAFTEVLAGQAAPEDYVSSGAGQTAAYDYLWFTRRSQGQDPCVEFEDRLRSLGRAQK